jgi:glutathione S-transferase
VCGFITIIDLILFQFPVFETGKYGEPGKLTKLEEAFQILDKYLEGRNWVTGKHLTIADFTVLSSVASAEVSKIGCIVNAIPVTGCEISRLTHFPDSWITDGG